MKGFEQPPQAQAMGTPERFRYENAGYGQERPEVADQIREDLTAIDPKTMSDQAGEAEIMEEVRTESGDLTLQDTDVDELVARLPEESKDEKDDRLFSQTEAADALDALKEQPHDTVPPAEAAELGDRLTRTIIATIDGAASAERPPVGDDRWDDPPANQAA